MRRMGAICDPASWTDQAIGEVTGSIEIKLVDVPDLGYLSNHIPSPQGEIWIRGPAVTEGYLDLEAENRESFYDGWFKTGDIGEFDENGHLRVIDRKKNMVKTLNGEYIALEKVSESLFIHIGMLSLTVDSSNQSTAPAAWSPTSASTQPKTKANQSPSSYLWKRR